jgi:hypothetical protein
LETKTGLSTFQRLPPHATRSAVLPPGEHRELLRWVLDHEAELTPSRVTGDIHKPDGRSARSYYGDPPWKPWMCDRIGALVPEIVEELGMGPFQPSGFEIELVAYADGGFISRHRDTGTAARRHQSDRIVSIVYYLHREPKGFSGGELRLWPLTPAPPGEPTHVDVPPLQNGVDAFPSWAIHEVLPVRVPSRRHEDARFAINFWARRNHG